MNGELDQLIVLATHGTEWLQAPDGPAPELDQTHLSFRFVRSVRFTMDGGWLRRGRTATGVAGWLDGLRRRGVTRLWLAMPPEQEQARVRHGMPEHMLAGFANAGSWFLLGPADGFVEGWAASWEVGARDDPAQRIWDITYRGSTLAGATEAPGPGVPAARDALLAALTATRSFAHAHDLTSWAGLFGQALELLDPAAPDPQLADMVPAGWPPAARRLAAASAASWVFGGMGSWNDLGFSGSEDNVEYERCSAELYRAVLDGLVASTNAAL